MTSLTDLLTAQAGSAGSPGVAQLLAARASGQLQPDAPPPPPAPVTTGQRVTQGLADLPVGLGQLAEHLPFGDTALNGIRSVIRAGLTAAGAPDAAALFAPVSAGGFDDIVRSREQDYQQARAAAHNTGIDWARLGGAALNPLNYAMPGGVAGSVWGRIGQSAAQGAAVAAAQPSTTAGNFWYDKAKGAAIGGSMGGAVSGVIEAAVPLVSKGIDAVRQALGPNAAATAQPAASATVNSALNAAGVDPATVNVNVLAGLIQEAQDALEHGETPSPAMIALRAKSESLPYPIPLMKGQLLGNEPGGAIQFAKEQNLRGVEGVGEPITDRLVTQNAAAINNLDALGAKKALNPVELGDQLAPKVQSYWDGLQANKTALYDKVRNSQGQPAMMDQFTAAKQIHDALDTPQASHAYDLLPANITRTIDDLADGKLPLTVAQWQALDKTWGAAASGADPSVAYAINTARRILGDAPVTDSLGQEAKQAYVAARAAHAQQMSLVDPKLPNGMPNPSYQPLLDQVVYGGKAPETLFQTHFMGAQPSVAAKNMAFVKSIDPDLAGQIPNTYMGEIKRLALSGANDERATVSQKVLSNFTQPVAAARMDAILQDPVRSQTFRNLSDVMEAAKRFPTASAVNTSNSGSAVVNATQAALKAGAMERLSGAVGKIPVVGPILNLKEIAQGLKTSRLQGEVQSAVNPGVTLKSLMSATPGQALGRRAAAAAIIPAAVGATNEQ